MQSDYPIKQISRGDTPCVGTYYDICPESPDGTRVVYSQFESCEVPGPAHLVIASRDGDDPKIIGESGRGIGHVGVFPQWLDDQHILSCPRILATGMTETRINSLNGGGDQTLPGNVRMYSETNGLGLVILSTGTSEENPHDLLRELQILRLADGFEVARLNVEDAAARIPDHDKLPPLDQMHFMNSKWSPDGKRFSVVFCNEVYRKRSGETDNPRFKVVMVGDADGGNLRLLGDLAHYPIHHPLWTPDSQAVIAMHILPAGKQNLVRYPVDGVPEEQILNARGIHSHLRADQKTLIIDAFKYPGPEQASVVRYDMATREMDVLASFNHQDYDHQTGHHVHPVSSRDGKRVYFNAQDTGVSHVYALELEA